MRYAQWIQYMYRLEDEAKQLKQQIKNLQDIENNLIDHHLTYAVHKETCIVYDYKHIKNNIEKYTDRLKEVESTLEEEKHNI